MAKALLLYLSSRMEGEPDTGFLQMAEKLLMDPPLGLWYLKAYAEAAGYSVDILDQRVRNESLSELVELIQNKNYDLIGSHFSQTKRVRVRVL